jgi:O-antigen ligase
MLARVGSRRPGSAAAKGSDPGASDPNPCTTPVTRTAIVLATFFSNGNFQDKIIPDSANSNLQQYVTIAMWMAILVVSYFRRSLLRIDWGVGLFSALAFYGFALASIAWSSNPAESASKGVAMCIVIFGAYRLVRTTNFDEIIECVILGLLLLNVASIFLSLFVPDIGILTDWQHAGQWNGIFFSKQTLGICGALLLFFAACRLLTSPRRGYYSAVAAAAIICVVESGSRGGGAVSIIAVACIYLTGVSTRFAKALAFAPLIMCLFGVALVAYFVVTGNEYLVIFDNDIDFTERTFIWQHALGYFKDAPLFGHGLNGFWTIKDVKDVFIAKHGWFLDNYHDGYIAIVMETGVIGMCVFMFGYLLYALRLWKEIDRRGALDRNVALTLVYTCVIFFIDFTETFFLRSTNIVSSLLVTSIFIAFAHARAAPARLVRASAKPAAGALSGAASLAVRRSSRGKGRRATGVVTNLK